jgi:hypothetical protein
MQVRDIAAREIADRAGLEWDSSGDLFHPEINLRLGTAYLAQMKAHFGRWDWALAGYNIGPTRLKQLLRRGGPAPTVYSQPILARWSELNDRHRLALARAGRSLAAHRLVEAPALAAPDFGRSGERVLPSLGPRD